MATTDFADTPELEDDYFEEELPQRPLRRRFGPATWIMLGLAMAAIAFYAGVRVEKHNVGSSSSTSNLSSLISRFRNAANARGTGATGGGTTTFGGGGGAASGTITLIDGNNIYVTQADGSIVKVITNPGSQFSITSSGTVANLHPGDNVTVTGPNDGNGNVTALTVTDTGASGGGAARRAGGGGGAGGGAAGGAGAAGGGGAGGGSAGGVGPGGG